MLINILSSLYYYCLMYNYTLFTKLSPNGMQFNLFEKRSSHPPSYNVSDAHAYNSPVQLVAAMRDPVSLHPSSWAGGVPGQLGGWRGLEGTRWASSTGDMGLSRRANRKSKMYTKSKTHQIKKSIKTELHLLWSLSCSMRICSACFRFAFFSCWFSVSI